MKRARSPRDVFYLACMGDIRETTTGSAAVVRFVRSPLLALFKFGVLPAFAINILGVSVMFVQSVAKGSFEPAALLIPIFFGLMLIFVYAVYSGMKSSNATERAAILGFLEAQGGRLRDTG
jgi:hypothetical protein